MIRTRYLAAAFVLSVCISSVCVSTPALALPPPLLPIQGQLTDADGAPLDGTHSVTFRVYDAAADGTPLFEETRELEIVQGYFTVYLGEDVTLPIDPFQSLDELYLGIAVADDDEATPRLRFGSTAFALAAAVCGEAASFGGLAPADFAAAAHVHAGADISSGTIAPAVFSAYSDLGDEGRLTLDDAEDLVTRATGDARFAAITHAHGLSCSRVASTANNGTSGTSVDAAYVACPVGQVMLGGGCTANLALTDNFPAVPCPGCLCLLNSPCAPTDVAQRGGWGCISSSSSDNVFAYGNCCTIN